MTILNVPLRWGRLALACLLATSLAACGGGSGGATVTLGSDATLADLTVTAGPISPGFVSTTTVYSVAAPGGTTSFMVTPTATDAAATINVDGMAVASGSASGAKALANNPVVVNITVTSEDGNNAVSYLITVVPDGAIAHRAYIKSSERFSFWEFGYAVALDGDTLVVGSPYTGPSFDQGGVFVFTRTGSTWTQQAKLVAPNPDLRDWFGHAVDISGDTIVVGAPLEQSNATGINGDETNNMAESAGAAYVFVRTGNSWTKQAYLKASNTQAEDIFGASVAIDGDTIAVGAGLEDSAATGINGDESDNNAVNSGAMYVFVRSGTTWTQQAYIKPSNTGSEDRFAGIGAGHSIDIDGDTLVASAYREDSSATGVNGDGSNDNALTAGAVYVFQRSGTTWTQQAYIKASNTEAGDAFGHAISLSGNRLAVGADREGSSETGVGGTGANNGAALSGAVYVFERSGMTWSQTAYIKASNTDPEDNFGTYVALEGDTLVVSAPGEDSVDTGINGNEAGNNAERAGAVYRFALDNGTWMQTHYIKAINTDPGDNFGGRFDIMDVEAGNALALNGGTIVIGAPREDSRQLAVPADNSGQDVGAVYIVE